MNLIRHHHLSRCPGGLQAALRAASDFQFSWEEAANKHGRKTSLYGTLREIPGGKQREVRALVIQLSKKTQA